MQAAICENNAARDKNIFLVVLSPNPASESPATHFKIERVDLLSYDELSMDLHHESLSPGVLYEFESWIIAQLIREEPGVLEVPGLIIEIAGMPSRSTARPSLPSLSAKPYVFLILGLEEGNLTRIHDVKRILVAPVTLRRAEQTLPPSLWYDRFKRLVDRGIGIDPITRREYQAQFTYADIDVDEPDWS